MERIPYVHGAGEPDPSSTEFGDDAKAIVDQWLAGVAAVRDGTFTMFFIEKSDHSGVIVRPDNVDEIDASIREHFAPHYPELIEAQTCDEA